MCSCEHGIPATGPACISNGTRCQRCFEGYFLEPGVTEGPTCSAILECSCENGIASEGSACTSGDEQCVSCQQGYQLTPLSGGDSSRFSCTKTAVCQCSNGIPSGPPICSEDGAPSCARCFDGFLLQNDGTHAVCAAIEVFACTCDNGTPASGAACSENGPNCARCYNGFALTQPLGANGGPACTEITVQTCECLQGVAASGEACTGGTNCVSCRGSFELTPLASTPSVYNCTAITVHTCQCANGIHAPPSQCPQDNLEKCVHCSNGFALQVDQSGHQVCVALATCDCESGVPAHPPLCTTSGTNCVSCRSGFHLTPLAGSADSYNCTPTAICECPNGIAAAGSSCTVSGVTKCQRCLDGFALTQGDGAAICTQIIVHTCSCVNGIAATGSACSESGSHCVSCLDNYALTADPDNPGPRCNPITIHTCQCSHGVAATGEGCVGGENCVSCIGNYVLEMSENNNLFHCVEKPVCTCDGGVAASGPACPTGSEGCVECESTHKLRQVAEQIHNSKSFECVEVPVCTCSGGVASTGVECLDSGLKCKSCFPGYKKDGDLCTPVECDCPHGVAKSGSNCLTGSEGCSSCFSGFHFGDDPGSCVANHCICSFGTPARGSECPSNNLELCVSCLPNYYLNQQARCQALEPCTCTHGFPATGAICAGTNGTEVCSSCYPGWTGSACNQCAPGWSHPVDNDGATMSSSCVRTECTCQFGTPASGPACEVAEENCESCFAGRSGKTCSDCLSGYHAGTVAHGEAACLENICSCRFFSIRASTLGTAHVLYDLDPAHESGSNLFQKDAQSCAPHGIAERCCVQHEETVCFGCPHGFVPVTSQHDMMEIGACREALCLCPGGIAAHGTECGSHESVHKCHSCNRGYHCSDGDLFLGTCTACAQNVCTCKNFAVDESALYHPLTASAYKPEPVVGFLKTADSCQQTADGGCCDIHESTACKSCPDGYDSVTGGNSGETSFLADGTPMPVGSCRQRRCTCPGGEATFGIECPVHGERRCTSCAEELGFKLVGSTCKCDAEKKLRLHDEKDTECICKDTYERSEGADMKCECQGSKPYEHDSRCFADEFHAVSAGVGVSAANMKMGMAGGAALLAISLMYMGQRRSRRRKQLALQHEVGTGKKKEEPPGGTGGSEGSGSFSGSGESGPGPPKPNPQNKAPAKSGGGLLGGLFGTSKKKAGTPAEGSKRSSGLFGSMFGGKKKEPAEPALPPADEEEAPESQYSGSRQSGSYTGSQDGHSQGEYSGSQGAPQYSGEEGSYYSGSN